MRIKGRAGNLHLQELGSHEDLPKKTHPLGKLLSVV
jgi:hypothetical protein